VVNCSGPFVFNIPICKMETKLLLAWPTCVSKLSIVKKWKTEVSGPYKPGWVLFNSWPSQAELAGAPRGFQWVFFPGLYALSRPSQLALFHPHFDAAPLEKNLLPVLPAPANSTDVPHCLSQGSREGQHCGHLSKIHLFTVVSHAFMCLIACDHHIEMGDWTTPI
jgi:hypothetical protein